MQLRDRRVNVEGGDADIAECEFRALQRQRSGPCMICSTLASNPPKLWLH